MSTSDLVFHIIQIPIQCLSTGTANEAERALNWGWGAVWLLEFSCGLTGNKALEPWPSHFPKVMLLFVHDWDVCPWGVAQLGRFHLNGVILDYLGKW